MLCSPFYGFNLQKQTNDKDPVDVKSGGPCEIARQKCCMEKKSCQYLRLTEPLNYFETHF